MATYSPKLTKWTLTPHITYKITQAIVTPIGLAVKIKNASILSYPKENVRIYENDGTTPIPYIVLLWDSTSGTLLIKPGDISSYYNSNYTFIIDLNPSNTTDNSDLSITTFNDLFEGTTIDTDKWNIQTGTGRNISQNNALILNQTVWQATGGWCIASNDTPVEDNYSLITELEMDNSNNFDYLGMGASVNLTSSNTQFSNLFSSYEYIACRTAVDEGMRFWLKNLTAQYGANIGVTPSRALSIMRENGTGGVAQFADDSSQKLVITSTQTEGTKHLIIGGEGAQDVENGKFHFVAITNYIVDAVAPNDETIEETTITPTSTDITIDKTLSFANKFSTTIGKDLSFKMENNVLLTEDLSFKISIGIDKNLSFKIKTENTQSKDLNFNVIASTSVNKDLSFAISVNYEIDKSLSFKTKSSNIQTEDLNFNVTTTTNIDKILSFNISAGNTILKNVNFKVSTQNNLDKALNFNMLEYHSSDKSLSFRILQNEILDKALNFTISQNLEFTKDLSFGIYGGTAVSKTLSFEISLTQNIAKDLSYSVGIQSTKTELLNFSIWQMHNVPTNLTFTVKQNALPFTKTLAFSVSTTPAFTKTLEFDISNVNLIAELLNFKIISQNSTTKTLSYEMATAQYLPLLFHVRFDSTNYQTLQFVINPSNHYTKYLSFKIKASSIKSMPLSFHIGLPHAVQTPIEVIVERGKTTKVYINITDEESFMIDPARIYAVVTRYNTQTGAKEYIETLNNFTKLATGQYVILIQSNNYPQGKYYVNIKANNDLYYQEIYVALDVQDHEGSDE